MTQVQIRRQTHPRQTVSIDLRTPSGRVLPF
jgi:hypothetical protein